LTILAQGRVALLDEDPRRSPGGVTFELGFSHQSALTRAFRRRTGKSLSDWRNRQKAG